MSNLKFFREDVYTYIWNDFFDRFPNKDDIILDFGCGAGWSIYFGRKRGFKVFGLDVRYNKTDELYKFQTFRDGLGISEYVKLYDGIEKIPFENDTFSLIVCRSSLMRYTLKAETELSKPELVKRRVNDLLRILNEKKTMVITPYGYGNKTATKLRRKGVKTLRWNQKPILKRFRKENPKRGRKL